MDITKKQRKQLAILLITKHVMHFIQGKGMEEVKSTLPESIFRNSEIIDKDELEIYLQNFLKKNEVQPGRLVILLDESITFEKTIEEKLLGEEHREIQGFLNIVPFENILSKTYHVKQKTFVVAANKDFCDEIIRLFELKDFTIVGLLPTFNLKNIFAISNNKLLYSFVYEKLDTIKQYSLVGFSDIEEKFITYEKPEVKSPRFLFLLSAFVLLSLFLFYFMYTQLFALQKPTIHVVSKNTSSAKK